jgi:hypothetical protein
METLKFNFCHPVKVIVRLLNKINPKQKRTLVLETQADQCAEIPVDGLSKGKWKVLLEWEYDGRDFFYEEEVEVS